LRGADTGTTQALTTQEGEPLLPVVQPRLLGGEAVQRDLRTVGGAPLQDGLFLRKTRLVPHQLPAPGGSAGRERPHEGAKLPVGRALVAVGKALARPAIPGGKELKGARADIRNLLACDHAGPQGQGRGQACQGWEGGLLRTTENPPRPGRLPREGQALGPLLRQQRSGAGQAGAHARGGAPARPKFAARWQDSGAEALPAR
jgi:hypothetical protein